MSTNDIPKGARWHQELTLGLQGTKVGIVCLTPENQEEPWLLFEAGAIAKTEDAKLCTFLLGMKAGDIKGPLANVQHTLSLEDDVRKLMRTTNEAGEKALEEKIMGKSFARFWPDLRPVLDAALQSSPPQVQRQPREMQEMLEEILGSVRLLDRRQQFIESQQQPRGVTEVIDPTSILEALEDRLKTKRLVDLSAVGKGSRTEGGPPTEKS